MADDRPLRIVSANEATWEDLECVFDGVKRHGSPCWCQRFKVSDRDWSSTGPDERAHRLREQTDCGHPRGGPTTGVIAFDGDEAVGWCAVEPRCDLPGLRTSRVPWAGRNEDRDDPTVWAITCVIVRPSHRGRHLTYDLVAAATDHARAGAATSVEGYPMITTPGHEITWGELHVGPVGAFIAAGFDVATHPTKRRRVVRIDVDRDAGRGR